MQAPGEHPFIKRCPHPLDGIARFICKAIQQRPGPCDCKRAGQGEQRAPWADTGVGRSPLLSRASEQNQLLDRVNIFLQVSVTLKVNSSPLGLFRQL